MRTTVELSDPLYRRLKAAAVDRGVRGFSPIVEQAVAEHLDAEGERRDLVRAIEAAEGAWTETDVADWEDARRRAWAGWKTDRS